MHPMDFEEFMWAMENENLMSFIKKYYDSKTPFVIMLSST